jgi:uncharacterized protein
MKNPQGYVRSLFRYPVKGLSAEELTRVTFTHPGECFPDDRRFALLLREKESSFDPDNPKWLHKENFVCAFSDPQLLSQLVSSYEIVDPSRQSHQMYEIESSKGNSRLEPNNSIQRLLSIRDRRSNHVILKPTNLCHDTGRREVSRFFAQRFNKDIICTTATPSEIDISQHQFGNTASGVKARGDTRTIHIINAETVKDFSHTIHIPIHPSRFRPNIVLEGLPPWSELDWVGRTIQIGEVTLTVIKQTVRCRGISIDPMDPEVELDIPKLLMDNFPQYGPYFGVYAVVDVPGTIEIGNSVFKIITL